MIPPVPTADERVVQFRRLLAYEIDRILSDLAGRRVLLLEVSQPVGGRDQRSPRHSAAVVDAER